MLLFNEKKKSLDVYKFRNKSHIWWAYVGLLADLYILIFNKELLY